jgi:hybrid polyketide synthase/nonribosomal peptide synthetase ACE1
MLEQATDHDQVESIVKAAFYEKVRSVFLLGNSISDTDLASMSFDQMGVDSLSAVEIRRWCMRTLEINIPVLKILNGATVGDLVLIAIETLPQRLVPNLETSSTSSDTLDTSDEQDTEDSQILSSASSAASLAQEQALVTE